MSKEYLEREDVLCKAYEDCIREMFAKAQPAADFDNIIEEVKAGKIDEEKDGPIYDRHYLSHAEFTYILNKYMKAYRINSEWNEDVEVVEKYLSEGGTKDKYIDAYTDENGDYHPGYRGYEDVKPIRDQIFDVLGEDVSSDRRSQLADYIAKIVMNTISTCKNFYMFNIDEQKFRNTVCMRCSPTGSAETVKKWWKDHYDVDIEIEERNPLLFWEKDYYGDEFEEIMEEEYGEDWKEIWDKRWKDEIKKKELEKAECLKKLKDECKDLINE